MKPSPPSPAYNSALRWLLTSLSTLGILLLHAPADAQQVVPSKLLPGGQSLQNAGMPPGQIGSQRMMVRPEMFGYAQPIRFVLPEQADVAVWDGNAYQPLDAAASVVRMQLGAIYRLKITGIPNRPGEEVYPSIEVINRLYPPAGKADQFPVVVHITQKELERALDGKYVVRVTYLEDPETALPYAQADSDQPFTLVGAAEDPLHVAASLGRPLTLVRMGSRIPLDDTGSAFELGGAPFQIVERTFNNGLQPASTTATTTAVQDNGISLSLSDSPAAPIRNAQAPARSADASPAGIHALQPIRRTSHDQHEIADKK